MGTSLITAKLPLVKRPISWLLLGLQALVIVAISTVALRLIVPQATALLSIDLDDLASELLIMASLAIIVVAAGLVWFQSPAVRRIAGNLPARLKRIIFLKCSAVTGTARSKGICYAVTADFRRPVFSHPSQERIVTALFRSIEEHRGFDVVVAGSGFGKTRCVMLLIESLVRHRNHYRLADRTFLYDLARGSEVEESLCAQLGGHTHANALVVVDNFHLAQPKTIALMTRVLLQGTETASERHIVLLAQPPGNWRLGVQSEIRLFTEARNTGRLHELKGLSRSDLIYEHRVNVAVQSTHMTRSGIASVAEIQAAAIGMFTEPSDRTFAENIAQELLGVARAAGESNLPDDVATVLGVAAALSLHRGVFAHQEFRLVLKSHQSGSVWKSWVANKRTLRTLKRLSRIGLVPRTSLPGRLYVLHERLAERFRDDLLHKSGVFEGAFRAGMQWRMSHSREFATSSMQWLGSVELGDATRLEQLFDAAMLDGGWSVMAKRLSANVSRFQSERTRYQLGVLLDQSGSFQAAREHLNTLVASEDKNLQQRAVLALVEAQHHDEHIELLEALKEAEDRGTALSAQYWQVHMQAHRGRFSPADLLMLSQTFSKGFTEVELQSSFFLVSLASRFYSDTARHVFLRGEDVADSLSKLTSLNFVRALAKHDPSHVANQILYEQAHALAFEVLPQMAIFQSVPEHLEKLGIELAEQSVHHCLELTRQAYQSAKDEFDVFGDREGKYLDADLLNLDIQDPNADVSATRVALEEYRRFVTQSGFADIASYPEVYAFRLEVRQRMDALTRADTGSTEAADDHEKMAFHYLDKIKALDQKVSNAYGLWRAKLYTLLLTAVSSKGRSESETRNELTHHKDSAVQAGFLRDASLLNQLLEDAHLSIARVSSFLIYHPFVHQ